MQVFKNKPFDRWARKERLSDKVLLAAVSRMEENSIDAALGGILFKQRLAYGGRGKSGGKRTILAYKRGDKAFFLYGFSKNEQDNISKKDEKVLKKIGNHYFTLSEKELKQMVSKKILFEVKYD